MLDCFFSVDASGNYACHSHFFVILHVSIEEIARDRAKLRWRGERKGSERAKRMDK